MGFSLKKLGSQIFDQVNPFDNGRTYQQRTPTNNKSVYQQAQSFSPPPVVVARTLGKTLQRTTPNIPTFSDSNPLRFANNAFINPTKITGLNVSKALQGDNPYKGNLRQQSGQAIQDAINLSAALPVGKGAQLATKGAGAIRVGLKQGAKIGAGFGAAQGVAASNKENMNLKDTAKTIALNTVVGGVGGGVLGGGIPAGGTVVNQGAKFITRAVKDVKLPQAKPASVIGKPVIHLPKQGVYAEINPAQQAHLANEVQNLHSTGNDIVHLSQPGRTGEAKKVSLQELTAQSPNAAKSIAEAPMQKPVSSPVSTANPELVNARLNNAADAERNKYGENLLVRAKNKLMDTYNPTNPLAKIDRANAQAQGVRFRDLPADQRLEHLHDVSSNSRQQAEIALNTPTRTGSSPADVIRHYGDGTPAGKEVNNYFNAKFDLEFRAKHGKPIQAGIATKDLEAFVRAYEAKDPNALANLATMKASNDMAVDILVKSGAFSKAEGEIVKNSYQNAVPLGRLISDNLERVQIGGKSVGSISKQTVVQSLTGNSHIPLDNTFKPLVDRIGKAVQQANKTKLAQAYADRVRQGLAPGELLVGAGNKAARKDLAGQRLALNKGIKGLQKEISINGKWARKLDTQINSLNKQGLKVSLKQPSEPSLSGKLVDPSVPMSVKETKSVVDSLVNLPSKDIVKIQKKIATREPKLAERLGQIAESKKNIEGAKDAKGIIKDQIAQLQDDPTTGRQVISGLVDGQPYKIEVPPEIAKVMQGLDETQLKGVLKVGYNVNKVFQTAWTGFAQPIFSLVSYALYDPAASVIISRHGYKTFRPAAVAQMFKSFTGSNEFSQALKKNGYLSPGGSMLAQDSTLSAEKIAASKSIFDKIKFNTTNPKEMLASIDILGGKLANSTRERIAMTHYVAAKKANMTEAQALQEAVYAANNVLPNYQRTAHLMKEINAILPYSGASVAGTRSITRALGSDPAAWARMASVGIAPVAAATAYSLSSEAGQEFYKDMKAAGKEYTLDNNVVIVLPGAHKDGKSGAWTGVWKIPVAPELRAINKTAWRATAAATGHESGVDPKIVAGSLFDTVTGGLRGQQNPAVDTTLISLNIDPRTGKPIVKGAMANEAKKDQAYDTTSTIAKKAAGLTGNRISPIQADKIVGQFSLSGELLQNKAGNPAKTLAGNAAKKFYGAYGETDAAKYYKGVDKFTATLNSNEKAIYNKTNPTKKDAKGNVVFEPTKLTKASDYADMVANPDYTAKYQKHQQSQKKHDPLWDLSSDQLRSFMQAQIISKNDPGGDSTTVRQLYDRMPEGFFASRDKYFEDLKKSGVKFDESKYNARPGMPDNLVAFSTKYHNLPYGTGARSAALRSPEGVAYIAWLDKNKAYNNQERADLGLPPLEDSSSSYASKSKGGSGGYGKGGSKNDNGYTGDPYKYAVSLSSGKQPPKPKVYKASKGKKVAKKSANIKVSLKKSKV